MRLIGGMGPTAKAMRQSWSWQFYGWVRSYALCSDTYPRCYSQHLVAIYHDDSLQDFCSVQMTSMAWPWLGKWLTGQKKHSQKGWSEHHGNAPCKALSDLFTRVVDLFARAIPVFVDSAERDLIWLIRRRSETSLIRQRNAWIWNTSKLRIQQIILGANLS